MYSQPIFLHPDDWLDLEVVEASEVCEVRSLLASCSPLEVVDLGRDLAGRHPPALGAGLGVAGHLPHLYQQAVEAGRQTTAETSLSVLVSLSQPTSPPPGTWSWTRPRCSPGSARRRCGPGPRVLPVCRACEGRNSNR